MRRFTTLVLALASAVCFLHISVYAAITVEVTSPVAGSRFVPCSDIELTANVTTEGEEVKDCFGLNLLWAVTS